MIWIPWIKAVWQLRPAFSREKTFFWFLIALLGFTLRTDQYGVSSIVRCLGLQPKTYDCLIKFFHSNAIKLQELSHLWAKLVFQLFQNHLDTYNDRPILLLDGLKAPKEGRRMPGVKKIFQGSQNNSKPPYIFGHSCQGLGLLVKAGLSYLCVPLIHRIHEGLGQRRGSIVMRAIDLINCCGLKGAYLVADAYYYCGAFAAELLKKGIFIVTRVKRNAVAFYPPKKRRLGAGRPAKYGKKVKLKNLFKGPGWQQIEVSLYGKLKTALVKEVVLLSKSFTAPVKYVLVKIGNSRIILASNDLELSAKEIIEIYGKRFKIEVSFKAMIHQIGGYAYRFWSASVDRSRDSKVEKRDPRKEHAYHTYIQISLIAHGLLNYLSVVHSELVWMSLKTWVRTIREGIVPSEWIVQQVLLKEVSNFSWLRKFNKNLGNFWDDIYGPDSPPDRVLTA